MADQPFPREQSILVSFLKGGLLAGLEGALNPDVRNEAQQLLTMFRQMDADHQERVLAQARSGRVLKQAVMQIFKEWQLQQSRRQPPAILGVRASLADTTKPDLT